MFTADGAAIAALKILISVLRRFVSQVKGLTLLRERL
jgi:hypothetical protein